MLAAGVALTPYRRLVIDLFVETGYVALPVGALVNGQRELAIDGAWLSGALGIGVML